MSRWSAEYLESMRQETDPLADACVHDLFEQAGLSAITSFHGRIVDEHGQPMPGLPAPMVDYLNATAVEPEWIDPEKLRLGESVLSSHGFMILLLCGCASLPECYADRLGMPVLFLTQKLNRDINRRIAETILFVKDVLSIDGFTSTGAGLDSARKVRLMHAAVRYLILHTSAEQLAAGLPPDAASVFRDHAWKESLGLPINQEDLAFTLQTFAWVIVRGMRSFHMCLLPEEEEAIIHCWNVAGYKLGIRDELLPHDVREAEELYELIKRRVSGPSEEGRSMTAAVMSFAVERIPVRHYRSMPEGLARYLVGDQTADAIGLPRLSLHQRWDLWWWVFGLSAFEHVEETTLMHVPFVRRWSIKLFQGVVGGLLRRRMTKVPFEIPDALAKHWTLNKMPGSAAS